MEKIRIHKIMYDASRFHGDQNQTIHLQMLHLYRMKGTEFVKIM